MIKGSELLTDCVPEILTLAKYLEARYENIIITSGYRSPEYNAQVGGAVNSYHIQGKAIDIHVPNVHPIKVAAFVMEKLPSVKGIGVDIFSGYCHFDLRDGDLAVWVYGREGKPIKWT